MKEFIRVNDRLSANFATDHSSQAVIAENIIGATPRHFYIHASSQIAVKNFIGMHSWSVIVEQSMACQSHNNERDAAAGKSTLT